MGARKLRRRVQVAKSVETTRQPGKKVEEEERRAAGRLMKKFKQVASCSVGTGGGVPTTTLQVCAWGRGLWKFN